MKLSFPPVLACLCFGLATGHEIDTVTSCDILIAGGSLSSLAAAITAANISLSSSQQFQVCLLEPTDVPGGQLTSSMVPPGR